MTTDVRNPVFARAYARMSERESEEQIEHRRDTLRGLAGRVLELGAGNGRNFAYYPPEVTAVVAVEPEPYLRERALAAAAAAPAPIEVTDAVADRLPFEDASFDAAVASLVLCSVPDQDRALAELHRVVRQGGALHFYEHVVAHAQPKRAILELADRSRLWPTIAGGCHPNRDTVAAIERAGFAVERSRRFGFAPSRLIPTLPHVLGIARRP